MYAIIRLGKWQHNSLSRDAPVTAVTSPSTARVAIVIIPTVRIAVFVNPPVGAIDIGHGGGGDSVHGLRHAPHSKQLLQQLSGVGNSSFFIESRDPLRIQQGLRVPMYA